ncbi:MAG: YjfB family protein, partial [Lachnospira sp.]
GGVAMNIAGLSMNLSTNNVTNDVSVLMLKKSLDTLEVSGDGLKKMMEASVTPNLGQNIDYSI